MLHKKLSKYPNISDWEVRNIIEFIECEKKHGRECKIECEDKNLLDLVCEKIADREQYINTSRPALIAECTACPYRKGCVTEFVCHTTSLDNAIKILASGRLLSALNARKIPVEQLVAENRNAAKDPADYFEYIMFAWGNCQAGDRLVMERKLKRFPDEEDLSVRFTPGIRFYFIYDDLVKHPDAVFDGVLPVKVKNEVILYEWVYAMVVPQDLQETIEPLVPCELKDKALYVKYDCKDIWDWSEKVYSIIENLWQ